MTEQQFVYWIQGWIELNGGKQPDEAQWKMICDHLKTVFVKVTPPLSFPNHPIFPRDKQVEPHMPWQDKGAWPAQPLEIIC